MLRHGVAFPFRMVSTSMQRTGWDGFKLKGIHGYGAIMRECIYTFLNQQRMQALAGFMPRKSRAEPIARIHPCFPEATNPSEVHIKPFLPVEMVC